MKRRRRQRSKISSLYIWHRYAGLFAALFVIFISVSGIALNHTDDLKLKKQYLSSNILLDLYRVKAPTKVSHFNTVRHRISQADALLFIDDFPALPITSHVVGAIELNDILFIGLHDHLLLIDHQGQVLETISKLDGVPNNISRIGINQQQHLILLTKTQNYLLTDNFNVSKTKETVGINWSNAVPISQQDKLKLTHQYRSRIINLETLMLDMHSGRFFGAYGHLAFDLIGLVLLFLATTGVIIWFKQRPKKRSS